jgi:translation elongation factor EF-G
MFEDESSASACGQLAEEVYGPMSGQVTSMARQAFRRALLEADPRLVEAMFLCEVSTTAEALSGGPFVYQIAKPDCLAICFYI